MCCSNKQRHAWTIVSTSIYNCFATGYNKLASSFKYFEIIFLHVFTTCYNTAYNKAISLMLINYYSPAVCLRCSDTWLEMRGLNWPHTSSLVEESPWISISEISGKDDRHLASHDLAVLSVILVWPDVQPAFTTPSAFEFVQFLHFFKLK